MSKEIIGNSYKYVIDVSYGINKDGFIAIGSESIVYKGLKTKRDGGMQFSCVLKFKPKSILVDGERINRLQIFKTEEWKIFEELRECRSIVRIDDVIEDLGDFSVVCNQSSGGIIDSDAYFCVVEEFIDGWSLEQFCREEYWKLRRIETLENNLSNIVNYNDFGSDEKVAINQSYNYENILKYQNQILLFMINLCDILEFVTEQKNILHLDIKPENIMVTRHGKELVLIDFGKSKRITKAERFVESNLKAADYDEEESFDNMFQYGSLGYAAPECYSKAVKASKFPFDVNFEQGKMSIESDIFSFGATFWECLNVFELVTKNEEFSKDPYDFYRPNFLNDEMYFYRDLSCTSIFYHKKLENILKKCTRKRTINYIDQKNKDYYHSYKTLRKDLENVKDSVPTIVKEENVKAKNAFSFCGGMLSLFSIFLVIYSIYHVMAFSIAQNKWDSLTANYNETQFYKLEETANDLIVTATANRVDDVYSKIARFTYQDGDISEYEAEMLVSLLEKVENQKLLPQRVDKIMQYANTRKFKEISTEIMRLDEVQDCVGYELSKAIYNVEVGKTEVVAAYEILKRYRYNVNFSNAIIKLRNVLDNDDYIILIEQNTGESRQEIKEFFKTLVFEEIP